MRRFRPLLRTYYPALLASLLLLIVTGEVLLSSLKFNDGRLIYGLDDAYIHMSIAKHFVEDGVWGTTPYGYTSTTSSPLWTFLVAAVYFVVGTNDWTPLVLNFAFAVGLLFAIHRVMRRSAVPGLYSLAVQVAIIILIPLNTLILSGMEHVLHMLLCVLFVDAAAEILDSPLNPALQTHLLPLLRKPWDNASIPLALLGALVGSARYEGLFLVLIVCGLLALRLRWVHAALLGLISAAPVTLYGLIALANGWDFLPTSLTIKSDFNYLSNATWAARFTYFVEDTYHILANQHVMSLLLLAALSVILFRYAQRQRFWERGLLLLLIFAGITVVNIRLVSWPWPGTFARYEAYLIMLALVVIPAGLGTYLPRKVMLRSIPVYAIAGVLILFITNDIVNRYRHIAYDTPIVTATREIYHQQYQMAQFLRTYYPGAVVVANDIGAINYYADLDNVDFWGLGTLEVARARRENSYNTDTMRQIVSERGGKIAVVYTTWADEFGGFPPEWIWVGAWELDWHPVILGERVVSFFAVDPAEAERLAQNLREFTPRLPDPVIVVGERITALPLKR